MADANWRILWDFVMFCEHCLHCYRFALLNLFRSWCSWRLVLFWYEANSSFVDNGISVTIWKKVILNYLKGWFCIDIIANFPIYYILYYSFDLNDTDTSPNTKLLRTPKILRFLKFAWIVKSIRLIWVLKLKNFLFWIEDKLEQ